MNQNIKKILAYCNKGGQKNGISAKFFKKIGKIFGFNY